MKKIISAILSMCMIISVFAAMNITVSAGGGGTAAATVYYCGEKLDADTPYLWSSSDNQKKVKASNSPTPTGAFKLAATFDSTNGTLTFNSGVSNLTQWDSCRWMQKVDTDGDGDLSNENYYGIYADGSLTINMESYAQWLFLGDDAPKDAAQEGIHINGDLIINGNEGGTLKVAANPSGNNNAGLMSYGVYAEGRVSINGGLLDVYTNTWARGDYLISNNKTTLLDAEEAVLNGGKLKLRGKGNTCETLYNIRGAGRKIASSNKYDEKWASAGLFTGSALAVDATEEFHSNEQAGDKYVSFELKSGYEIAVFNNTDTPVTLSGEMRYLAKSGDGYIASSNANDAYAEYIASEKTLNILKDTELTVAEGTKRIDGASSCINSESDLIINIPEDVTLSLSGQNNGRNKNIRAKGDITIRGEGSLKAFACKDYLGTGENSAAIWSDNGDVTIEGKINANLYTRELSQGQIAHVIYAGGNNINIGEYATVTMGTDIGKLFNDGTVLDIYQNAEAKMAASAETKTTGAEPKSELIDYNASNVSEMKYLSIAAMPIKLEKISGFDSRNMLPLSKPEIELTFNLEIAEAPSVQDLSIDNGAKISGISVSGRSLKISLSDVKADGEYTLKLKNIKNAAGLEYAEDYSFKVSGGSDVLSIKLNGSESGEVKANNSVSVTLSKAASVTEMNAVVTVVVWDKVTVGGKTVKRLKSAASQNLKNITGTKTADFSGIAAETDDIIEVFVWNSGTGLKVLSKAAEFAN